MSAIAENLNKHKVLIIAVGGIAVGLYLLLSKAPASSGSSTSSSSSTPSTAGYTAGLNTQYQDMLMSQALSNQAQLQSESVAGATQIGLAQQKTAQQANNLTALTVTGLGIDQTLQNQNNNQANLYGAQGAQLTGQGASAFVPVAYTTSSTNSSLPSGSIKLPSGAGGSFSL